MGFSLIRIIFILTGVHGRILMKFYLITPFDYDNCTFITVLCIGYICTYVLRTI